MAIDATDWTIDRSTKIIAYTGDDHGGASPTYATVIQFHRWLQDLADDAVAVGDDQLDITNVDPSRRSTDNIITLINGYTIGDTEAEHLFDGSIIYSDGDEIYDGIVNFGNADVQIQIIQNGAVLADDWWNYNSAGLNPDLTAGISHRFMIKTRTAGADVDGRRLIGTCRRFGFTYSEFSINGTARGNNVLALTDSNDLNNETIEGTVSGWGTIENTGSEGYTGIDVDNNGSLEYYYSEWNKDIYTINQFYERMKWLTRDGSASTLYGINGELFRGITHQVAVSGGAGTWVEPESLSWGTGATAGTGQLLAVDDVTASSSTVLYMQLLTGVIPSTNTITGNGGATATAGVVTERTISKPFCGASTGSAIIGAYGFGIEVADLTSNDKVTDLGNNVITPPNYVTNTVGGLIHNEDRILVGPWDGTSFDVNGDPAVFKTQLSLATALTVDDVTEVVVSEAIPSDTPSAGYIRVTDDLGYERRLNYASWDTSTFTLDAGQTDGNEDFLGDEAAIGNDVWIGYLDKIAFGSLMDISALVEGDMYVIETVGTGNWTSIGATTGTQGEIFTKNATAATGTGDAYTYNTSESFTSVQSGSRDLVVLVRDGGSTPIKQFISSWSQTSSAGTITAIRTTDA